MKKRINSSANRDGLAIDAIKEAHDVWPGHGTYTTLEHFFLSGTSLYVMPGVCYYDAYILIIRTFPIPHRSGGLQR
jgi:hypothetical protein